MTTAEQVLIEEYGCKDRDDLIKCFLDNAVSLTMITDSMKVYAHEAVVEREQAIRDLAIMNHLGFLAIYPAHIDALPEQELP